MKKVKDHYYKKAKKENYPARSVYKLEEAQKRFSFLSRGDAVLDLGCHPGSWSIYAAKTIGVSGKVIGIDLQKTQKYSFSGAAKMDLMRGDIYDDELFEQLLAEQFKVVLSDMAPKTTGHKFSDHLKSIELSRRALEIAKNVLPSGGHFYCKVFQGEDFPDYVSEVKAVFKKVKVVKPKSSRIESREVFVLGREKK
jgi:23S rRNA (uridine2552-2'-O)-methyltransferase